MPEKTRSEVVKPKRIGPGISRWPDGTWEVRVHLTGLPQYHRRLPATHTQDEVEDHVDAQRKGMRRLRGNPALAGTLAAAGNWYLGLPSVQKMPSFKTRKRHIKCWVHALGHKLLFGATDEDERAVQPFDVSNQLDYWQVHGLPELDPEPEKKRRGGRQTCPLSDSYLNRIRTALGHLYSKKNGKKRNARNPALEVDKRREPKARPKGVEYEIIETILSYMPDRGRAEKGQKRRPVSHAKLRCTVIAYGGLRPEELMRVLPLDWSEKYETLFVRAAKESQERTIPLFPQVTAALTALRNDGALWDAHGQPRRFSTSSVRTAWQRAWMRANEVRVKNGLIPWPWIEPYALRHSFLTEAWITIGDLETVRQISGHADLKMLQRYTLAGVPARVAAGAADLRAKLTSNGVPKPPPEPTVEPRPETPAARRHTDLTREELHTIVWSKPVQRAAEEIGISDVALAKHCRRHGVPLPPRGYWARLAAGQRTEVTPLPPIVTVTASD